MKDAQDKARSAAHQERLAISRAKREKEALEKEERRQARELAKAQKREATRVVLQRKVSKKALKESNMPESMPVGATAPTKVEEVVQVTSRGRRVAPHRFRTD